MIEAAPATRPPWQARRRGSRRELGHPRHDARLYARAIRQAIAAGVKSIDHGQLIDDATAQLMAEKGIWWSLIKLIENPGRNFRLIMKDGTIYKNTLAK